MATLLAPTEVNSPPLTAAELLEQLGGISPARVRLRPPPGQATESDVLALHDRENRLFELVDGVLVEKAMGFRESVLAAVLIRLLGIFVDERRLGVVTGADGMMRLAAKTIRIPDIAYIAWSRMPGGRISDIPVPDLAPDLAIEVLSPSNTTAEMTRKCREYFAAGTKLVWIVDPDARTVSVFTSSDAMTLIASTDVLDGGDVLPGFTLPLDRLFSVLDQHES